MPRNLELKAHIRNASLAVAHARECGAHFSGTLLQTDTYFSMPEGRLKLREFRGAGAELISYVRDEQTNERWSEYRKVPIADPGGMKSALAGALGVLVVVEKERQLFMYKGARIHIDTVGELGAFLEFEVPADGSVPPEGLMRELRENFSVTDVDVEKGSYSDLILAKSSRRGA
jgi:adenylate cyclase class IV